MDVFGIIGMTFGMAALGLVVKLRKEFDELKQSLNDSGLLKHAESENK